MARLRTVFLSALLVAFGLHAQAAKPQVSFVYGQTFDFTCSLFFGGSIKDEWKAELVSRMPELEELWAKVGPKQIEAAEEITGKPFPEGEITTRLTLCNLPSQSFFGISVNMRYALKSFVSPPVSMRDKVETVFHELLHVFLSRHPVSGSELLVVHAAEPWCVRNHLHLLALHKAVLLKRQEPDVLRDVVSVAGQLPNGCYKRAWELVNATEDEYARYVAELGR